VIAVLLVEGRRKDLMRVRDRNLGDRRLMIQGAGIRSIAGIDRFDGLLELDLADLREPELELLEALPELEWLSLGKLRGCRLPTGPTTDEIAVTSNQCPQPSRSPRCRTPGLLKTCCA
jgi:hypothetical protein